MGKSVSNRLLMCAVAIVGSGLCQGLLLAQAPTASTVPFLASSPTTPHTSWAGNPVTLKGTFSSPMLGTDTFTWDWDPGDGGPHCTGVVDTGYTLSGPSDNPLVISCPYTYSGSGPLYTAVLNVTDTNNGTVAPSVNCPPSITSGACYYTSINAPPPNLPIEVNNAIDNGLWFIHTYMNRTTSGYGAPIGNWYGGAASGTNIDVSQSGDTGPSALDCTAFEVSGFLASNNPPNPYSADAVLCVAGVFDQLTSIGIGPLTVLDSFTGGNFPTINTDQNNNGIGVQHNGGSANYETGMMLDSIVAAGTPTFAVPTGTLLGAETGGLGSGPGGQYLYSDAVQDMVDDYAYCENPGGNEFGNNPEFGSVAGGGWHYDCQESTGDNSVSQWAAIGIIPARRSLGSLIDPTVLAADQAWLDSSFYQQTALNGYFGYTSNSPIWGPYADTPSGLVQLAMSGLGRGTTLPNWGIDLWDPTETFIRDNFGNPESSGAGNSLQAYYYGMFSFTKSMLLHDNSDPASCAPQLTCQGMGNTPIQYLQSLDDPNDCASPGVPVTSPGSGSGPCYPQIDWYAAQTPAYGGTDPTVGVARTIVNDQIPLTQSQGGSWFGQSYASEQFYFQTPIAIIMLNKTVFQAVPVACFTSSPSHVASGGPVEINGNCSVDQNPANTLVSWQWDLSGMGAGYTVGPGNPLCLSSSCSQLISNFSLPAGQLLPYMYPVRLLLTDSAGLTATVSGDVVIANPPNPPSANAGGPYNFCPNVSSNGTPLYAPFLLNGQNSTNPDQGKTDGTPGAPPSTIVSYLWDYACAGTFTSASGAQVDATAAFDLPSLYGTSFNVCLQVTNNDNLAFPTADLPAGLSSVASAEVTIHQPTDSQCSHCVTNLQAVGGAVPPPPAKVGIQLSWTDTNSPAFPIAYYNVYRSTVANFSSYIQIAGANSNPFIPAVPVSNPSGQTVTFIDGNVTVGTIYYYRIDPATANNTETCQGNVASAIATDTPPAFTPPANIVTRATSPSGATVTYTVPTATDYVDGTDPVTCAPGPGSTFPITTTTVSCSATNSSNMTTTHTFTVTVLDAPPVFTPPANQTLNATNTTGSVGTYILPIATDFKDGTDPVVCRPVSGSTFPIGTTTVTCSATNSSKMTTTHTFTITVDVATGGRSSVNLDMLATPAGATLWFNSSFKVSGAQPASGSHLYISGGTITYGATTMSVPDAIITFSGAGVTATTTFDTAKNIWNISAPYNFTDDIFLAGAEYALPAAAEPSNARWSADFATDNPSGLTVLFQGAAAAYAQFGAYGEIGVKALHATSGTPYHNADQAGTPENEKPYLETGGTGTGGTNYTGTYSKSDTVSATPVKTGAGS